MIGVAKGGHGLAQKLKNAKEIVYGGWGQYVPDGGRCIWKELEAGAERKPMWCVVGAMKMGMKQEKFCRKLHRPQ